MSMKNHDIIVFGLNFSLFFARTKKKTYSIHDWLAGVKIADTAETEQLLQPAKSRDESLDTLTDSDRLRLISGLITGLPSEGGAGIHPGHDEFVESILPLHDKAFNKVPSSITHTVCISSFDDFSHNQRQ